MSPATTEVNMEVSRRTKNRSTYEPAAPLLAFTQWSRSQHIAETPVHRQSAQFTTAKCPSTQAWIEKFPQSHRRAKSCHSQESGCSWRWSYVQSKFVSQWQLACFLSYVHVCHDIWSKNVRRNKEDSWVTRRGRREEICSTRMEMALCNTELRTRNIFKRWILVLHGMRDPTV